jgi:hypothetical protein
MLAMATTLIRVRVAARAKRASIKKLSNDKFEIAVKEPAEENRANAAVLTALSTYLKIPVKNLRIIRGHHHSSKVISIPLI